jgi:hypothetical protein
MNLWTKLDGQGLDISYKGNPTEYGPIAEHSLPTRGQPQR